MKKWQREFMSEINQLTTVELVDKLLELWENANTGYPSDLWCLDAAKKLLVYRIKNRLTGKTK